jgi:Lrp/AsnC family transcriptional regulator, leucine-responsive regulatory protein
MAKNKKRNNSGWHALDETDLRIISILQENGRVTNVELARMNDLAPSSMLERVRRLEERGIITGYRAVLDGKSLGFQVEATVMVTLDRHREGAIDEFEEGVQSVDEIRACHHVTGRYDYILQVVCRDIQHLGEFLKHELGALKGVEKLETFLSLSRIKQDRGYALEALASGD